jgi:SAM-dependent methyltransferase
VTELDAYREFWDRHARRDPLWAILSDPSKKGRRWDLESFLETGTREISLLMYQLRSANIEVRRDAALDFGCGVGRLTQALAQHFDRVVGVDVSPEMIRLADQLNAHPARVQYVINPRDDLRDFQTREFTFVYSDVVLQHLEPELALSYLAELLRVVVPGGLLVFQLPSHARRVEEPPALAVRMPDDAYSAGIVIHPDGVDFVAPGRVVPLRARVQNTSPVAWRQNVCGSLRIGNHWRHAGDRSMLIQDDGRAALPETLAPGEVCWVSFSANAPALPGRYVLECDVVHEGVTWFGDKGSATWSRPISVSETALDDELSESIDPRAGRPVAPSAKKDLVLDAEVSTSDLGEFPMYGVPCEVIEAFLLDRGAELIRVETDERAGPEWVGFKYFVRSRR